MAGFLFLLSMNPRPLEIAALLLLGLIIFSASNGGSFILDDSPNLKTLERLSHPLTLEAVSSVLFTNSSGAFGRYIPMASFVLQYQSWPLNASAFRMANIAIHLFNGLLIWFFLQKVLRASVTASHAKTTLTRLTTNRLSLCATAIWLLHPLQTSSVLYIVQRSAELSASFTLLGLLLYLQGRHTMLTNAKRGYFLMALSIIGLTLLASLCKENGVLLPLYILLLEFTVFSTSPTPAHHYTFMRAIFGPLLVASIWFIVTHAKPWVISAYALRDFTLTERLLTESRVLVDYMRVSILPPVSGFGVFHDDFPISHDLLNPTTTIWCLLSLAGLVCIALAYRKRAPLISFALLWFFVAHSMESSVIPLEIYFEHRNYLALLGPALALSITGRTLLNHPAATMSLKYFFAGLFALWFGYISFITWHESRLWGQRQWIIAEIWALDHPESLRAQSFLANALASENFSHKSAEIYKSLAEGPHHSASAYLDWLSLGCKNPTLIMPNIATMEHELQRAKHSASILNSLERFVLLKESKSCEIKNEDIQRMFVAALNNSQLDDQKFSLYVLQGRLLSASHQTDAAIASFANAFNIRNDVEVALLQVKTLAEAQRYDEAITKLPLAIEANKASTFGKHGYALDIEHWRQTIEKLKRSR